MRTRIMSGVCGLFVGFVLTSSVAFADLESFRESVEEAEGIVDYFALDEDFVDFVDGSNGQNDGVPVGIVDFDPDGFGGGAAIFDGTNAVNIVTPVADDMTIMCLMKTDIIQLGNETSQFFQGNGLIYADRGGCGPDFGTAITGDRFAFGTGCPDETTHSTSAVTTGEWVFVCATRRVLEAGNAELKVYVNGTLEATHTHPSGAPLTSQPQMSFGGNLVDNRFYTGLIDEVAILEVAIDDDRVAELYSELTGVIPCFTADPEEGFAPLDVNFDATCSESEGGEIESYMWDFGDGNTAEGETVAHTFTGPGAKTVKLTVVAGGIPSTESKTVQVNFRPDPPEDILPWISDDVGEPLLPGGVRVAEGCVIVFGAGQGYQTSGDQAHIATRPAGPRATLIARISDVTAFDGSRMGITLRNSSAPDSSFAHVGVLMSDARGGIHPAGFSRRSTGGSVRTRLRATLVDLPDVWLRIERDGVSFTISIGSDGVEWTELQSFEIEDAADTMLAGFAVTAQDRLDASLFAQATFCDVSLESSEIPDREDCAVEGDEDGNGLADCDDPVCVELPECKPAGELFARGDVDASGSINLSDGINLLLFQFQGGDAPACLDAADTDDSGSFNLTDAIKIFQFLFLGGEAPLAPSPSAAQYSVMDCGADPTIDDEFDCLTISPTCAE